MRHGGNKYWTQDMGLGGVSVNHSPMVLYQSTKCQEWYIIENTSANVKQNENHKKYKKGDTQTQTQVMMVGKPKSQPLHHDPQLVNLWTLIIYIIKTHE